MRRWRLPLAAACCCWRERAWRVLAFECGWASACALRPCLSVASRAVAWRAAIHSCCRRRHSPGWRRSPVPCESAAARRVEYRRRRRRHSRSTGPPCAYENRQERDSSSQLQLVGRQARMQASGAIRMRSAVGLTVSCSVRCPRNSASRLVLGERVERVLRAGGGAGMLGLAAHGGAGRRNRKRSSRKQPTALRRSGSMQRAARNHMTKITPIYEIRRTA